MACIWLFSAACATTPRAKIPTEADILAVMAEAEAAEAAHRRGQAVGLHQKAARQAESIGDLALQSQALNDMAVILHAMKMNHRARDAIDLALEIRLNSDIAETVHILQLNRGQIHWSLGNLGLAESAFEVATTAPDPLLAAEAYYWLSEMQRENGLYDEMLETTLAAVVLAMKTQPYQSRTVAEAKMQWALALANTDQVVQALEAFDEALMLWESLDTLYLVPAGQTAYNYGLFAHQNHEVERAIAVLGRALIYAEALGDEESILRITWLLDDIAGVVG